MMYTTIAANGTLGPELQIDNRTCECCKTAMTAISDGLIAVYRDRSDKEIREAESEHVVRAPVRVKVVVPVQFVPNLISALQEHWRVFSDSYTNVGWNKGTGPVH